MTGEPPSATPITQVSPTLVALVIAGTLSNDVGASGKVRITAPLP